MLEIKRYYVYELVDPASMEVFYVGKGQGNRANTHLSAKLSGDSSNLEKREKIAKIRSRGMKPLRRVVGRYESEEEAFAVEATLIHWMYGRENLTNIQAGRGSSTIRNYGELGELEGIDIPRSRKTADGRYTEALRNARKENDIITLMTSLRDYLVEELNLDFSDLDVSRADRTRIYADFRYLRIRLGAFHSKAPAIVLRLEAVNGHATQFQKFCNQHHFQFTDSKRHTARFLDFERSRDFREIAGRVNQIADMLKP
jgi:hypothetical protein